MFWSPAVTTLSVCAAAGNTGMASSAATAAAVSILDLRMVLSSSSSTSARGALVLLQKIRARKNQQRVARNRHGDRSALLDPVIGVRPHVGAFGVHAIAVALAHIECLRHVAGKLQL